MNPVEEFAEHTDLIPVEGGYRVKTTQWFHVDVMQMAFGNWRLCETYLYDEQQYQRGWCYSSPNAFVTSVIAALAWTGSPDTEPGGWIKEVGTGRRRPDGDATREFVSP